MSRDGSQSLEHPSVWEPSYHSLPISTNAPSGGFSEFGLRHLYVIPAGQRFTVPAPPWPAVPPVSGAAFAACTREPFSILVLVSLDAPVCGMVLLPADLATLVGRLGVAACRLITLLAFAGLMVPALSGMGPASGAHISGLPLRTPSQPA